MRHNPRREPYTMHTAYSLRAGLLLLAALLLTPCQAQNNINRGSLLSLCGRQDPITVDVSDCYTDYAVPMGDVQTYYVQVPANSDFNMQIILRSYSGDGDLQLITPNGTVITSNERLGNDVVYLSAAQLKRTPGMYFIGVVGYGLWSEYNLVIQTSPVVRLAEQDVAVLQNLIADCCPPDDNPAAICTGLQRAVDPNRATEDDLCSQAPNICDMDGRLMKLVLSGSDFGNLVCKSGFPQSAANLTRLQILDLSKNRITDDTASVVAVISKLNTLEKLFLHGNALDGPLDCGLFTHATLQVLWLSENLLKGSIPACATQSTQSKLEQISLKGNQLAGPIPDFRQGSPLIMFDISDNGPKGNSKGINGTLPYSIQNAKLLEFLDISNNAMSGQLPDQLPPDLQSFSASNNDLSGPLPSSLGRSRDLRVLRLANNRFNKRIPLGLASAGALISLRLANNQLTGPVAYIWNNQFLQEFDVSNNKLSGDMPYSLMQRANLQILNVAGNSLVGNFSRMQLAPTNALLTFNMSGNSLQGTLPSSLQAMRLFSYVKPTSQDYSSDSDVLFKTTPPAFDISNTKLSTVFPDWLSRALGGLYNISNGVSTVQVRLYGNNKLTCPTTQAVTYEPYMFDVQKAFGLQCQDATGSMVPITQAMGYDAYSPTPGGQPAGNAPGGPSDGKKSNGGAIAGAIIGSLLGLAAIAGVGYFMYKKGQDRRNQYLSRRVPLTFNSAYDPSETSGQELTVTTGDAAGRQPYHRRF